MSDHSWRSYVYKEDGIPKVISEKPMDKPGNPGPGFKDMTGKHLPYGVRIPDPAKYDKLLAEHPHLVEWQNKMKAKGLKDPWLRNEAWRFDNNLWGTKWARYLFIFRTAKYGALAFAISLTYNTLMGITHDHHHHHPDPKYQLLKEMDINQAAKLQNPEAFRLAF